MPDYTLFDYPDPLTATDTPLASWPDVLLALLLDAWAHDPGRDAGRRPAPRTDPANDGPAKWADDPGRDAGRRKCHETVMLSRLTFRAAYPIL